MSVQQELVVFVDKNDQPTGETGEKLASHHADTKLHAAFSCYVFDDTGQFLVTKRASVKKVWPNVWTNTCCGHPMPGETREDAIKRRLEYELGMSVKDITLIVPDYTYKTPPYNGIIEHEYCPIYTAIAVSDPHPNPQEVSDYKWVSWQWFLDETAKDSDDYSWFAIDRTGQIPPGGSPQWSWWCKDQIKYLKNLPPRR